MRVLLGAALLVAWPLTLYAPGAVASADPCPDVQVVFARGTTEAPGLGEVGQAFVDSLRAQTPGRSVADYAVNYPATDDYANSTAAGVADGSAHVEAMTANCPDTRLVLGGYSQGASVVDVLTTTMPPQVADHVSSVAVFGNPKSAFADTLAPGPLPTIGPLYADKTIDLCVPGDPICTDSINFFAHLGYVPIGLTNQAASFAASRL